MPCCSPLLAPDPLRDILDPPFRGCPGYNPPSGDFDFEDSSDSDSGSSAKYSPGDARFPRAQVVAERIDKNPVRITPFLLPRYIWHAMHQVLDDVYREPGSDSKSNLFR